MQKYRQRNTKDLIFHLMKKIGVPLSDNEIKAGHILNDGATRRYNRTPGSGSTKKEYDTTMQTLIEDVEILIPDESTPAKVSTARLLLLDRIAKDDEGRRNDHTSSNNNTND